MRKFAMALSSVVAAFVGAAGALAVGTSHWTHTNEADFKKGTLHNVVATNLGDLKLSRAVKALLEQDPRVGSVSALAEGPDGAVYAGTGPHAVLLRVKDDQVSVAAALEENASINALLFDPQGRLLVATGGARGRILRLDHPEAMWEKAASPAGGSPKKNNDPVDEEDCDCGAPSASPAGAAATQSAPRPATQVAAAIAGRPATSPATRPAAQAATRAASPILGRSSATHAATRPATRTATRTGAGEAPVEVFSADGVQYVWAMQQTPDGKLYAATGPNGQVFEIDYGDGRLEDQGGAKGFGNSVLFDGDENNVLSLVSDGKDVLYAGTDPNGLVYRIQRKTGETFVLYDAPEAEVTCLALDAKGNLYAGTAEAEDGAAEAKAADAAGAVEKAGRPEGAAGVPLPGRRPDAPKPPAPDPNPGEPNPIPKKRGGEKGAGLSSGIGAARRPGRGRPGSPPQVGRFVGIDGVREWLSATSALMLDKPGEPKPPAGGPGKKEEKPAKPAATAPANKEVAAPDETGKARADGNAIYRIDPDGFVTEVFRQNVLVMSMVEKDGVLLVGTGNEGLVYQVNPAAEETVVLAKVEPKHVLSLLAARDGRVILGLANVGGLAAMSGGYAGQGTFSSPVLDAAQISRFGKMNLHGTLPPGATLTVATRSGNVQDPAKAGWSPWSEEIPATEYVQVPSPAARFLQYRLTLAEGAGKESPVVDEIDVAYQTPNLAPVVRGVKIAAKSDAGEDPNAGKSDAGKPAGPGNRFQTISWDAEDGNGDPLQYSLAFRAGAGAPWIVLKEKLTETHFDWDTRTAADGRYEVKVQASDAAANPPGQGKSGSRVSDPIVVDNTPPVIGDVKTAVKGGPKTDPKTGRVTYSIQIEARLVDRTGTVAGCEYSVNSSADWQAVLPSDKMFDSPEERVSFTLPGLSPGPHQVTLRATDAKGNQAFESVLVTPDAPGAKTARR